MPHFLIASDALRDVLFRLWEGVFYFQNAIRCHGAVKKFPEMWYSAVMVGYMTTLTESPSE
jgi:hypothetical protein